MNQAFFAGAGAPYEKKKNEPVDADTQAVLDNLQAEFELIKLGNREMPTAEGPSVGAGVVNKPAPGPSLGMGILGQQPQQAPSAGGGLGFDQNKNALMEEALQRRLQSGNFGGGGGF